MGFLVGKVILENRFLLSSSFHLVNVMFQARRMQDYGSVELDDLARELNKQQYVPSWFSVDLKTGVSCALNHLNPFLFTISLLKLYL